MSLTGRLEDLGLADIFQILSIGKKTGSLTIQSSQLGAFVFFKNGLVVRADTDALKQTVGEELVEAGLVSESALHLAQEVRNNLQDKLIEEILIEIGSVRRESVEKAVRKRVERVIYELLILDEGEFKFEPDVVDLDSTGFEGKGWELARGLSPEYLLMEGARVYDEAHHYGRVFHDELFDEETTEMYDVGQREEVSRDFSALKALSQELRFPENPSEVSLLILRFASDIFQRGVLFSAEKDTLKGLGQFGLDVEGADEKIQQIVLDLNKSVYLRHLIHDGKPIKGALEKDPCTEHLIREIGGGWPLEVAVYPVVAENKVVALLYCDNEQTGEQIEAAPGLEIFITQAGLALEKAMLKKQLSEREEWIGGEK